ncbi:MAG TPA: energy-coupling factor transporter transmembrane protein EcfT [Candidatus Stackebrandtia faecavium]|nr:energy-coupling factor transporter transmembrane protein EcfT [Candidatus Stackebrandtia faecavium]
MLSMTPLAADHTFIARRNPVAKLICNALASITILMATDWFTPSLILAIVLLAMPFSGVTVRGFAYRMRLMVPAAATVVVVAAVFAAEKLGTVVFEAGPIVVTTSSIETGVALGLRVLAIASCAVLTFATTDPTELADSLIQQWRVPARFAIGSLAALRLLPLLSHEWHLITMARRARGIDAGVNPLLHIKLLGSIIFALLVGAIRRGTRLATAMDSRGFDSGKPRTIARPQHLRNADWCLMAAVGIACAATLTVSMQLGVYRGLF